MPPRSSSPICERSLDLTLIGIGRRDIPQCSSKHFHMEAFYQTFSGGQRPSLSAARPAKSPEVTRTPTLSGDTVRLEERHYGNPEQHPCIGRTAGGAAIESCG